MAEEKKETKETVSVSHNAPAKASKPFSLRFAYFMLFVTMFVFLPTTILFSVCLLPTLIAYVIDDNPDKTAWLTVGAMNFAGTVPIWFNLWNSGHTIANAFEMIIKPMTIIVSYGGAAVGWFIYINITPFVAGILQMKNEARMKQIEKRQQELVRKWGKEVVNG